MRNTKVSYRYSTSLLENAVEKNNLETVAKDMELVSSVLNENRNLRQMIVSPIVKPKVKDSILTEIFESRIDKDSMNFIRFVVKKNREDLLQNIVNKFLQLRDEHFGIVNVDVKTVFDFSQEQKDSLRQKLESLLNKKIRFKFESDENIVGGFIAKVNDTVFDASIKNQLEILKKQFLHGSASLN